jgi:hypothetical protein
MTTSSSSTPILVAGKDLTLAQKDQLKFNGMKDTQWVNNHSFYFNADGTKCQEVGFLFPVCHSLSHLPY